ncbi:hypothetical protein ACWA06_01095 [Serratia rhizosphaerae]|uniref:Lipoprotein n=1 Tax=Serratia rhizosphaerae TaxID=2597702 RepID=A0ABX6GT39_9GAMM|nr:MULTISPECIES: hypothetical protein [Serratia]MBU3892487.1 hypothetical protein [Serratia rubidaea]AVJ17798.1 hypothetical protein CLM71_11980 [Serratia sp. MYb239]MEB6336144.1 hypothetical protein [Serratia rhizosphaerae]QHA89405.1 hypothetical protein FO014_21770 [Serratia rhizosphaerae]QNK34671.1 hypothetical protein HF675_11845 [Serratia sp. JUb9]
MRTVLFTAAVVLLSGCGLSDELDAITLENHQKVCDGYGFTRGTEAYANCLMRQDELEDADEQRALDREARKKK